MHPVLVEAWIAERGKMQGRSAPSCYPMDLKLYLVKLLLSDNVSHICIGRFRKLLISALEESVSSEADSPDLKLPSSIAIR